MREAVEAEAVGGVAGGEGSGAAVHPLLAGSPYQAYAYSYPHKTAHRPLDPPVPLAAAWAGEDQGRLSLYLHVPFCEMRCGFCNLFTLVNAPDSLPRRYLTALRREAEQVRAALPAGRFARLAIGGGTPTFLEPAELVELFAIVSEVMGADPRAIPACCETSPATATPERLALLRQAGVDRLSIGVQSFAEAEARAMGRPQRSAEVERALRAIREAGFPTFNIDLIYGGETQTPESFRGSVRRAIDWRAEEVYLYPLYVRPLTGLGKGGRGGDDPGWDAHRQTLYRAGRAELLAAGYEQVSMRMFRAPHGPPAEGPVYCCQDDGMVGLGCGARSYTRSLHYSHEYAVGRPGVRQIITDYVARDRRSFAAARHGYRLDGEDQRRRFVILSLLQSAGLDRTHYQRRFGADPLADLPALAELAPLGLAAVTEHRIRLTPAGLALSDAIGPWLYSPRVRRRMEAYPWR